MPNELKRAIADMKEARLSHQQWADYFAACPFKRCKRCRSEAEIVGGRREQLKWVRKYDNVIRLLESLPAARAMRMLVLSDRERTEIE